MSSVDNALQLLLLLREREALRVTATAEHLGVAPSTAHRLLSALCHRGFAQQDSSSRIYSAGPALIEIGLSAVVDLEEIRGRARPAMRRITEDLEETTHLMILEGRYVRFVDSVESPRGLRVGSRVGQLLPAHCVSGGKALLANLDRDAIEDLYPDSDIGGETPRSIVTKEDLLRELQQVRARGFAVNQGESEPGVSAVGVAFAVGGGSLTQVALAAAAPTSRLSDSKVEGIASVLITSTRNMMTPPMEGAP